MLAFSGVTSQAASSMCSSSGSVGKDEMGVASCSQMLRSISRVLPAALVHPTKRAMTASSLFAASTASQQGQDNGLTGTDSWPWKYHQIIGIGI
eukprot:m.160944 g.160944  ORF g.160944 m.160944 type:complete len:94 (+) comp9854_c0_seq9:60-341(+)